MDSVNTMSSLVVTPPGHRNLARALVARFLGRRPFPLVVLNRVLLARGKVGLNTVVRTLCNPSWPQVVAKLVPCLLEYPAT